MMFTYCKAGRTARLLKAVYLMVEGMLLGMMAIYPFSVRIERILLCADDMVNITWSSKFRTFQS